MMWKWSDLKKKLFKSDFTETAVVVWPVLYPVKMLPPEDPHCTIFYLGPIDGLSQQDVIDAIKETNHEVYPRAAVKGLEWFGPDNDVPVLTLDSPFLYRYNDSLESALARRGITNGSEFSYSPHVTITQEAASVGLYPDGFTMLPVQLWWGGEHIRIYS